MSVRDQPKGFGYTPGKTLKLQISRTALKCTERFYIHTPGPAREKLNKNFLQIFLQVIN